jgi:hypothetical protein
MPSTRAFFVATTIAASILTGFVLYPDQPAAQQPVADQRQSAAQLWAAKRMAELEPKAQAQTAEYDRCVARLQADYNDDPAQAYDWVRTLCRP